MKKKYLLIAGLVALCAFAGAPLHAQENQDTMAAPAGTAPDNTEVNVRDRQPSEMTADQGGNQKPDREIMAEIRKAVVSDKALSTYAHNVKIISVDGKVTLKGPVRSEAEIKNIEDKASQVAGQGNVMSELSVKTKH
jgi:osmotically-inducible protein OsmY